MRLSLRFVLPLMLVLAGIAPLVYRLTLGWFVRDLGRALPGSFAQRSYARLLNKPLTADS